jgi:hypothetical protein
MAMEKSLRERMFEAIRLWQQSGLTKKAWCEKNNVTCSTFHYWYKRYRLEESEPSTDHRSEGGFVQLMVDPSSTLAWCELILRDGRKLAFRQPVSAEFIRSLID